ncbi:oligosaccharide flippase family protein [Shewanella sp. PP-Sp27a-2]
MSNKNNFKISSILYALGSILSASISFIFIPFFMSEFTSVEFGIYSLILICSSIGAAIFYLGVTSALTRSFFDFTANNERNNCFFTALVLLAFGGVMQIVLGFFVSNGISLLLFNSINWNNAILIALISSSFGFINFAFLTYFRLVNKPYHFFTFSVLSVVGNMLGMYLFVIIEKQGVLGAIKGPLISQVLMFIIFLIYHWKLLSRAKYSKIEGVVQLKYGFYTVLSSLGGLAILWADQFFINKYLNLSDVGVYALSVKLAGIITVVFVTPFIQVFNPIVMEQKK